MKTIALLITLLSTALLANPMCKKVESINYQTDQCHLMAMINLSDGTSWRWAPDIYSETLIRDWKEGDEVVVQQIDHPGLALHNLARPRFSPIVALSADSLEILPVIAAIEDGVIMLEDESLWQPVYHSQEFFLKYWLPGDRVLVTKSLGMDRELINLSIPYASRGADMRTLAVWPYLPPIEEEEITLEEEAEPEVVVVDEPAIADIPSEE